MRPDNEVNKEIDGLLAIASSPSFRRTTIHGEDNMVVIEAEIEVLRRRMSVQEARDAYGPSEHGKRERYVRDSAIEAAYWLSGEELFAGTGLVDGWEGFY